MLDGIVGEFELNIGRFSCMLIPLIPMMIIKKEYLILQKRNVYLLPVLCILIFSNNYANYAATVYIPSGTANIVYNISFMLTSLVVSTLRTFYNERKVSWSRCLCDGVTMLLLTAGVILVIQPESLFGNQPHEEYISYCNPSRFNSSLPGVEDVENTTCSVVHRDQVLSKYSSLGFIYGISSGMLTALYLIVAQIMFNVDSFIVVSTWVAFIDTLLSLLCTGLFESFAFPVGGLCIAVLLFHALFTGIMTVTGFVAAVHLSSNDISVISSASVPIVFSFQFSVLKKASPNNSPINSLSITAAIATALIAVLKPLIECITIRKRHKETNIRAESN